MNSPEETYEPKAASAALAGDGAARAARPRPVAKPGKSGRLRFTAAIVAVALASCAQYRPIVDMRGVDRARYESDLQECQQYAAQIDPAAHAAGGAILVGVLGALLGAAAGSRYDAGAMARVGAVSGAAGGAAHGAQTQIDIVRRCMSNRGYSVLN